MDAKNKFLNPEGLIHYDEKIKAYIKNIDKLDSSTLTIGEEVTIGAFEVFTFYEGPVSDNVLHALHHRDWRFKFVSDGVLCTGLTGEDSYIWYYGSNNTGYAYGYEWEKDAYRTLICIDPMPQDLRDILVAAGTFESSAPAVKLGDMVITKDSFDDTEIKEYIKNIDKLDSNSLTIGEEVTIGAFDIFTFHEGTINQNTLNELHRKSWEFKFISDGVLCTRLTGDESSIWYSGLNAWAYAYQWIKDTYRTLICIDPMPQDLRGILASSGTYESSVHMVKLGEAVITENNFPNNNNFVNGEGVGSIQANSEYAIASGRNSFVSNAGYRGERVAKYNIASGINSSAEGLYVIASGKGSHAEGLGDQNESINNQGPVVASGDASHAEGYVTKAEGMASHAEGESTIASGAQSHAQGSGTVASGDQSHASGYNTVAAGKASFITGSAVAQDKLIYTYENTDYEYDVVEIPDLTYVDLEGKKWNVWLEASTYDIRNVYNTSISNQQVTLYNDSNFTYTIEGSLEAGTYLPGSSAQEHDYVDIQFSIPKKSSYTFNYSWTDPWPDEYNDQKYFQGNLNIYKVQAFIDEAAIGDYSAAIGLGNITEGTASAAIGSHLITSDVEGQVVVGSYNKRNESAKFIVGNGTAEKASNALSISDNWINAEVPFSGDITLSGEIKKTYGSSFNFSGDIEYQTSNKVIDTIPDDISVYLYDPLYASIEGDITLQEVTELGYQTPPLKDINYCPVIVFNAENSSNDYIFYVDGVYGDYEWNYDTWSEELREFSYQFKYVIEKGTRVSYGLPDGVEYGRYTINISKVEEIIGTSGNTFTANVNTKATAKGANAFGVETIASATAQTAIGKFNAKNNDALFIVGCGSSNDNRKNAFEVISDSTGCAVKLGDSIITEDYVKSIKSDNCVSYSENSPAFGSNTVAGTKGYYYNLYKTIEDVQKELIKRPYPDGTSKNGITVDSEGNIFFPARSGSFVIFDGAQEIYKSQEIGLGVSFLTYPPELVGDATDTSVKVEYAIFDSYLNSEHDEEPLTGYIDYGPSLDVQIQGTISHYIIKKITIESRAPYSFTVAAPKISYVERDSVTNVQVCEDQPCTIPADISTWQVGDRISLVNDYKYDDCATITSIKDNVIITTELPFDELVPDAGTDADDYTITNINHPETGSVDLGYGSAAFGEDNKAINRSSFVAGRENEAMGQYSAVFGRTNKGTYGTFVAGRNNKALEDYSVVMGQGCTSKATAGVAMGNGSSVDGAQAGIALGQSCKARACGAVALGSNVYTNYSEDTDASGDGSGHYRGQVVVGRYNANPSDNAFVVGAGTKKKALNAVEVKGTEAKINVPLIVKGNLSAGSSSATGTRATAIGSNSTASGNHSLAGGSGCTASGSASVSLGMNSQATNTTSVAAGHTAISNGIASIALGQNVEATNTASIALGHNIKSNGVGSVAIGRDTQSTNEYSFGGGRYSVASGQGAFAFGYEAEATGARSIAIGQACKSYSLAAVAIGSNLITAGDKDNKNDNTARGQFVCGRYNAIPDSNDIFVVGNGDGSTRSNAFKVKSDGSVVIGSITLTTEKLTKLVALVDHVVVDEATGDITLK